MSDIIDAQELRRRWTDKTNAVFGPRDRYDEHTYPAADYEREFDFKGCRNIVFLRAERTGSEEDVILLTQGSGHMTLPAKVQVLVQSGYVKCEPAASAGGAGYASTIVGGPGIRAPPPSRVSGYAPSSAGSAYSGAVPHGSSSSRYQPSPPRDASRFSSYGAPSGPASNYMSARGGSAGPGDWEVVEEASDFNARVGRNRDDACSIGPDDSISSVGVNRNVGGYSRRYSDY